MPSRRRSPREVTGNETADPRCRFGGEGVNRIGHGGSGALRLLQRRGRTLSESRWVDSPLASARRSSAAISASLIGRSGSSAFRLSAAAVSMSLTGSCFSSESAPRPFHHGIRGRGGTIFAAALPSEWQVQAEMRTHLIHRPARDIIPPLGGARVSSYRM